MVTSKRVANAKSEKFYKQGMGKKKQASVWQGLRKQLAAHPLLIALFFFLMVFSGIFTFFASLPSARRLYGGDVEAE